MPFTEMVVMIAIITALVLGFIHLIQLGRTALLHRTVRRAIDREPGTAQPLLDRLTSPEPEKAGDDRTAVLLIAFGVAMLAATWVVGDLNWMRYGLGGAMFPLIIGAALGLRAYLVELARRR